MSRSERGQDPVTSAPDETAPKVAEADPTDPLTPPGEHGFGPTYWRSLGEKLGSPDLLAARAREFPEGADEPPTGLERRHFLQLIGASAALAGAAGCVSRPDEKILPYHTHPEGVTPGRPLHYATAAAVDGHATGLLVTSWEGRPTKVEGNPDHPSSLGATGVFEQALLLQLYDPQRARVLSERGQGRGWKAFTTAMARQADSWQQDGGGGLRLLVEPTSSPLLAQLRERLFSRFPEARLYAYSAASDAQAYAGAELAFGAPFEALYAMERADVIVSLDADFVQPLPENQQHVRAFAHRRDPSRGPLNRLYVAEASYSLTGTMADHRLRVRSAQVVQVALGLAGQLGLGAAARAVAGLDGKQQRWIEAVARDLQAHRGRSLVVAGRRQPPEVHALAHALNEALGNVGTTVRYASPALLDRQTGPQGLSELAQEIRDGKVQTLVITAKNPVYTAPADLEFGELLGKVPTVVYQSLYEDETARHGHWFLPAAHVFESWGDARAKDGTLTLVQPLIQPLFNGSTEADLLIALAGGQAKSPYDQLRELHRERATGPFETQWESWLAVGIIPGSGSGEERPRADAGRALSAAQTLAAAPAEGLEVNFALDYTLHDGRFANVTWLQELPDPMTKLTWGNAALMSARTADGLGVKTGDGIRLGYQGRTVDAPVFVLPGHADGAVTLPLGYGREGAEQVAAGHGFNAYRLRTSKAPWFASGLTLEKIHQAERLAQTQEHWSMEGRSLALAMTPEQFEAASRKLDHMRGPVESIIPATRYEGYKWAMAVDLARCIGCEACMIACQAENNIPVVGKEQVIRGREMHWLRIDRYFEGDMADPRVVTQPVACVHCETAPCEYVCPVNATVHSDEGLNEMVYNRCVGTRYCANNCPYKVRRFNYFSFNDVVSPTERLGKNPDVTVRARGVMEKCSYCVQRIQRARIDSRVENRRVREAEVQSACAQACPTEAISFGTLDDPEMRVTRQHQDPRHYYLLHELGTRPRTAHLVRIRNLNPELT